MDIENGRFSLELFIEFWCHSRFGVGNYREKLAEYLVELEMPKTQTDAIMYDLFEKWVPPYLHYFEIEDNLIWYFLVALAARSAWEVEIIPKAGATSKSRLWQQCVEQKGLSSNQMTVARKFSWDFEKILSAINGVNKVLPDEIHEWLFSEFEVKITDAKAEIDDVKAGNKTGASQEYASVVKVMQTRLQKKLLQNR
ncbi:hypothetical protein F4212_01010 [Candidatus Poribacteria bacterium]|nr:hypothetical protein [Candidatus Poribacteria bacterium]